MTQSTDISLDGAARILAAATGTSTSDARACLKHHVGSTKRAEYINTTWELRSYDVWGNAKDGYEVNDTYRKGTVTIRCKVQVNNAGTPQEFLSTFPSDSQIRKALSLRRFKLETDGDDLSIYVNRARDGYPCGEMYCTSHDSLSPIRAKGVL